MSHDAPRRHVRLYYPPSARPSLLLESGSLDVLDLSERGLRYRQDSGPEPAVGTTVEGILRLIRGETLAVRGTVVRVARAGGSGEPPAIEVSAYLSDLGIPRRVIIAERQALQEQQAQN